ncbi:MAG: hypothetical protein NC830_03285 [Candidatus Omnitrophica bacterium]|nr:hypothetical protein [Candidatus Omnitrophota bacterium]
MIRPRYDHTPQDYQYAISPLALPTVPDVHFVPQVIPWETPTAVLAIGCAQRNVTLDEKKEVLSSITLTITDIGNSYFDPNSFFRIRDILFADPENPYSIPGVTLWKDVNDNGIWEPPNDTLPNDTLLMYNMSGFIPTGNPREWTVTLYPVGDPDKIDEMSDQLYDYFVVIKPSSEGYSIGAGYKIWIQPGGILFGPLSFPQQYAGISSSKVKAIYNNIFVENLAQGYVDPTDTSDPPDLTSNVIPVFGMNIASGPANLFPNEQILQIRIDLLAYENIDPDDIAPLRDDNYSGITLWRDNKNPGALAGPFPQGNFDLSDTVIPCKFSSNPFGPYDFHWQADGFDPSVGAYRYHTYMTPTAVLTDPGTVYHDDVDTHSGIDFFICLRTNSTLPYGSKFRLYIPPNEILLTGAKYAETIKDVSSTLLTGNVFVRATSLVGTNATISPQSQPTPVMKLDITDNNSGKNPQLTGITVEFYNRGGFTLTDLASFSPLVPRYNPATGWYEITNFNTDSLKQCGVVIYRANASGGIDWNNPVMIQRYRFATSTWFDTPPGYQFEFQSPVTIPCTLYVVIRTSASMSGGDAFSVGIVGWGAYQVDWDTWASRAIPVVDSFGNKSNSFIRKQTEAFNFAMGGTLDLYAIAGFDGIGLNWINRTNVNQAEFIKYEIWRTDNVNGETAITVIPVPEGWSASEYFDLVSRGGAGGLIDGVTYNYQLIMTYSRGGQQQTVESNRVSAKVYGFPAYMTPSRPTAVASTNGIAIWFRDKTQPPYQATSWLIQRTIRGQNIFSDVTTVDTVPTFYDPYIDTTAQFDVVYQYRVIARRQVTVPGATEIFYAESYPSDLSDPSAIYSNDPGIDPVHAPSGGGGGCFIATAAFGTNLAKEVEILRQFRDRILLKFKAGEHFVSWYYTHSPSLAYYIERHNVLKMVVRLALYPLIAFAWIMLHKHLLLLIISIFFALLILKRIFSLKNGEQGF